MTELSKVAQDLRYVRSSVERRPPRRSPRPVYVLWAVLVALGFAVVDFRPQLAVGFWSIAGPLGFAASWFFGMAWNRRDGEVPSDRRPVKHWGVLMGAMALGVITGVMGLVDWSTLSPVLLLVIGLAYLLAGVHLERPLLWVGLALWAGYLLVLLAPGPMWTVTGLLVAAALLAVAWYRGESTAGGAGVPA